MTMKNLLPLVNGIAEEKGLDREVVFRALEEMLVSTLHNSKGLCYIDPQIDRMTGECYITCEKEVVEEVKYPGEEISHEEALEMYEEELIEADIPPEIGDQLKIVVDVNELDQVTFRKALQDLTQTLRRAEREIIHRDYKAKIGTLVTGTVKKIQKSNIKVDLGKVEAVLPRDNYPQGEFYNPGESVRVMIEDVRDNENGIAEIVLTRSSPNYVKALFMNEVPELGDGVVEITKIARAPGVRVKLAVISHDQNVDPVAAMIGAKGSRINAVRKQLPREDIDLFQDSSDLATLLRNALALPSSEDPFSPDAIKSVRVTADNRAMTVVVDNAMVGRAMGRFRKNATLTGEILDMDDFEILSEKEYEDFILRKKAELIDDNIDETLDEAIAADSLPGMNQMVVDSLASCQLDTPRKLLMATPEQLEGANVAIETLNEFVEELINQRM